MAKPLTSPRPSSGALELLGDGVHLLRATPFATLAWHWAGSLPLAAGSAFFWNDITHPHPEGSRFAAEAAVLAILLAWMNVCRAVYAGRLRRQLAGAAEAPLRPAHLWRMGATQAFLGATKLFVLPLALVSTILLAPAVAFYRNAAVLSGQYDEDPHTMMAKARRLAGYRPEQSWKGLGLLACVFPIVLINVALTLALLPQLVRTLTGYESAFSRLGANFVTNGTFWFFAFALSWLAFDPYVQAVYCVRCFQAESAQTGEDVRTALRRLRGAGPAVAALLAICALALPLHSAAAIPPEQLQRAVQEAAQAPEYDWRIVPATTQTQQPSWFVAATDRIVHTTRAFFHSVGVAIDRLLRWIFGRPEGGEHRDGPLPVTALPLSVYALILLVLAVCGYLFVHMRNSARAEPVSAGEAALAATREDAEEMDPLRFPEQSWIVLAERCLADEDWRLAMRAFYLASLGWLGRREFIDIHSGKTNREYEAELRRRTRSAPQARALFSQNVAAFERAWYGMHEIGAEDVAGFRQQMQQIQRSLEAAI